MQFLHDRPDHEIVLQIKAKQFHDQVMQELRKNRENSDKSTKSQSNVNHDENCNELQLEDDPEVLPSTDTANAGDKATDENQKELDLPKPKFVVDEKILCFDSTCKLY